MSEKFHTELDLLRQDTIGMARFARDMLAGSIDAFIAGDEPAAREIVSRKRELQERVICLEDRAYQLIALYQPMARDMRVIVCILKMIAASERIGRYGKDIGNMVKHLEDQPSYSQQIPLPHMAALVTRMIDDATVAFEKEDLSLIRDFSSRDDTVDVLWHSFFREMLTFMMENPATITRSTYMIMAARYLERSGDHACKMAENVHYAITGERIEFK